MKTIPLQEFRNCAGTELGPSDWFLVDQDRISLFADATEDHQFIHVDGERSARTPFGSTIAHGYLTLSLLTHLNSQYALAPAGIVMGINYGSDKVRYLQPVKAGSRVRFLAQKAPEDQHLAENAGGLGGGEGRVLLEDSPPAGQVLMEAVAEFVALTALRAFAPEKETEPLHASDDGASLTDPLLGGTDLRLERSEEAP